MQGRFCPKLIPAWIAGLICISLLAQSLRGADAKDHWAFRKPVEPAIPQVADQRWAQNPIDAFIFATLQEKGLHPAHPADKRTLIRRAYFDLIGLPPTPGEVAAFEADQSSDAFAKVVDHLLSLPQYGERWGRYWLDVARYSDTKGYVFQEERKYPYAYTYRDWVVRSLNEDLPYDQFLIQQIAADQLQLGDDKRPLAAMGFLTLGRRFLNSKPDIIDDRIDVVGRGTMAMTVGCARCHDHKFDPIPTKDYYSLYSIFNNSNEPTDLPLIGEPEHDAAYDAFEKEVAKRQGEYDKYVGDKLAALATDLRTPKRIADYLMAAQSPVTRQQRGDLDKDLSFGVVNLWRTYLQRKANEHDSVFAAWRAYAAIPATEFSDKAAEVTQKLSQADGQHPVHPLVLNEFSENAPKTLRDVADRYGALLARYDKPEPIADESEEWLRQVLRGEDSPLKPPKGTEAERLLRRDFRDKAMALRKKIEEFKATSPANPPRAMVLEDSKTIEGQRVFLRGNAGNPGDEVKPHFLTCLAGTDAPAFTHGSGRLELAKAIASKDNPLTARVMVNRVWLHHFGFGLVRTPSDFGTRSDPPTHPELLDYLALRFMDDGWSIKKLHRRIMLSATYQQSSDSTPEAQQRDAENLLLSHANRQRLDFEAMRDSMIYVSGKLDRTIGGRAVDITTDPSPPRRSIYAFIDRQNLPGMFRNFDFASPDATCPRRFSTTVPQQALFMLNSPFLAQQVRGVLDRPEVKQDEDADRKIADLYQLLFDRAPTAEEMSLGRSFIAREAPAPAPKSKHPAWAYGYGQYDRAAQVVKSFTPFPVFTGSVYQGGSALPDNRLAYALLTADGGHPGNDLQHAVIRRWISPINGSVRIGGTISHNQQSGDGVHAAIVSSRLGELAGWNICRTEAETVIARVEVKNGDILDFVVDCRSGPDYDSFSWPVVIRANGAPATAGNDGPEQWSAAADFAGPAARSGALSPWEKYVQVLMESNEFMFVD